MRRIPRVLKIALGLGAALYLAAAGYMGVFQRSFLYKVAPGWVEPAEHGLKDAQRFSLQSTDGITLSGWWIAPKRADAPVFLYFHGNANGLQRRAARFGMMSADGAGVLAVSYRGYGGSGGAPSEAILHADAQAIHAELAKTIAPERIVLFGESLGSGVALNLARKVSAKAVILDSPYLSILARGQADYPWLPVSWLLIDTFRSDLWIGEVKMPILILHGSADQVVPPSDSEKLALNARPGGVKRILFANEPHVVPYDRGPKDAILAFLRAATP